MRPSHALLPLFLAACAPPPEVELGGVVDTAEPTPTIEILYPENGQEVLLDADCNFTDQIIVNVENYELDHDAIDTEPVDGVGHWHGGPDLAANYCLSGLAFCVGGDQVAIGEFNGTILAPGRITLFAQLQSNDHQPTGNIAQVEVDLVDATGGCP